MAKVVGKWVKRRGPLVPPEPSAPEEHQAPPRATAREVAILAALGLIAIVAFTAAFVRVKEDRGIRLWMLNHGPDQLVVVNPDTGELEKELLVADGLQQVVFNHSKNTAFVANVVDISNRVTLIDTRTYLRSEQIVVDGVPQGLAVFPDDEHLAVITASKTDFMAGGFDVLDLTRQSAADPKRKRAVYRERDLALTAFIAVDEYGEHVYCLDAKASHVFIFSFDERKLLRTIDIGAAPMGLLYPEHGDYFFVSSIKDKAITVLRKARDPQEVEIVGKVHYGRFRHMALSHDGRHLFAPVYEQKEIAVIDVKALGVVKTFKLDEGCGLIAASPVGNDIYAVGFSSGKVYVLDADTGELKRTIATHGEFRDIEVILESDKPSLREASAG